MAQVMSWPAEQSIRSNTLRQRMPAASAGFEVARAQPTDLEYKAALYRERHIMDIYSHSVVQRLPQVFISCTMHRLPQ